MSRAPAHAFWRGLACVAALSLAAAGAALAEDIDRGFLDETALRGLEQGSGFVVDRTITHFGAEFVRHFSAQWREQPGIEGIDVAIVERPSARWGSVVYVERNQRPVARVFLYAGRSAAIRPLAEAAARHVASQAADDALAGQLLRDPDLSGDELR